MMRIRIVIGNLAIEGELNDTSTARKVAEILPISAHFDTWGEEIYFTIPVVSELDESAREVVKLGDLGYWPTGKAFCIFFGQTPMSSPGKIIPASAVNIIGSVIGDVETFKEVMNESEITLEPI
ncbi:cyclophilin-like fold protein [Thermodesulfobacteriota bacterium]